MTLINKRTRKQINTKLLILDIVAALVVAGLIYYNVIETCMNANRYFTTYK
jgi:hypothetical protein